MPYRRMSGIKACQLSSSSDDPAALLAAVLAGEYRIVYMTPERVTLDTDLVRRIDSKQCERHRERIKVY